VKYAHERRRTQFDPVEGALSVSDIIGEQFKNRQTIGEEVGFRQFSREVFDAKIVQNRKLLFGIC